MRPSSQKRALTGRRFGALIVGSALAIAFAGPVTAAGESTPGATVKVTNPTGSRLGSDIDIALTARTERAVGTDGSCRPEDATLRCWGSLMLRLPGFGDLAVGDFEVHRVAVGDIACDDEEDEGGCDHELTIASVETGAVLAQVNGVGSVKWAGNSGLAVGTRVQVKFTLMDNGATPYADQVVVQVNLFVDGPNKPLLFQSGPETVRQVEVHVVAGTK